MCSTTFCFSFAIFVSIVYLSETAVTRNCPNPVSILPCNCSNEKNTGPGDNYIATCNEIAKIDELSRVTYNLKDHFINRFVIFNSDIGFLPNAIFKGITVKEIFVRNTALRYFSTGNESAFTGVENSLDYLLMRKCALTSDMPLEVFGSLSKLTQLDIGSNIITVVKDVWFKSPPLKLQLLFMRQNHISFIEPFAFAELQNLVLLDLAENNIRQLQRSMFPKPFKYLTFLYLSYNQIPALPSNIFTDMPSLQRLYLDFNRVKVLDADSWIPVWGTIKYLDLMGNDISCDCSLHWMTELNLPPRLYGECSSPKSLKGHTLSTLWPWHISEAPEMIDQRCASITGHLFT